jgi:hypothetical protein
MEFRALISFPMMLATKYGITGRGDAINMAIAAYMMTETNTMTSRFVSMK